MFGAGQALERGPRDDEPASELEDGKLAAVGALVVDLDIPSRAAAWSMVNVS